MQKIRVNAIFFFLVLFAITAAFIRVLKPFLLDIIVSAVLANVFFPLFKKICVKFKERRELAAAVTTLCVIIIVSVPLFVVGTALTAEVADFLVFVKNNISKVPELTDKIMSLPVLDSYEETIASLDLMSKVGGLVNSAAGIMVRITQNAFLNAYKILFNFFIVVVILFFFFVDGQVLIQKIKSLLPLKHADEDMLIARFKSITDATIKGTIIIAILEGTVGGLLLALFGMPSPAVWTVIIVILSMFPIVGTNLVLIPVAIFMFASGRILAGLCILIFGVGFVLVSQNIIKPKLVGDKSGLHPAVVLLSTLGGIVWLGLIGFIIGPVIAALCIAVWNLFGLYYKEELEENAPRP